MLLQGDACYIYDWEQMQASRLKKSVIVLIVLQILQVQQSITGTLINMQPMPWEEGNRSMPSLPFWFDT